jgi:hypothetical protein
LDFIRELPFVSGSPRVPVLSYICFIEVPGAVHSRYEQEKKKEEVSDLSRGKKRLEES